MTNIFFLDIAAKVCGYKANLERGLCPTCGQKADLTLLRDQSSRHEYMRSRMCMQCQDEIFRGKE